MSCSDCQFYLVNSKAVTQGYCRRYPPVGAVAVIPTTVGTQIQQQSFWPTVNGAHWCGEYQRKVQPDEN